MNDQPAYVSREEFERRIRVLEGEVAGEKLVTRHVLEQTHRNGDELAAARVDLATLKLRADHTAGEIALVRAALTSQTGLINVLGQDVTMLRQDMAQMRGRLDTLVEDVAAIRAALAPRGEG